MDALKKLKAFTNIFGVEIAMDSIFYTLYRDSLDKRYRKENFEYRSLGSLSNVKILDKEILFEFQNISLSIKPVFSNGLKITWKKCEIDTGIREPDGNFKFNYKEDKDKFTIFTDNFKIEVEKDGKISFFNNENEWFRTDLPPEFSGNKFKTESRIRKDSIIYGLGEHAKSLNLRGNKFTLWNHDANGSYGPGDEPLYLNIPVYYDLKDNRGYFVFYNNPSRAEVDLCYTEEDEISFNFDGCGLEYYIFFGKVDELLKNYADLTGHPALVPKWSLGFHQSRYSYMSEDEVLSIAENFKKYNLPISAIHLDIDYMDGYRVFTFDKERFPNVKGLAQKLKTMNINLVVIIDPGVKWDPDYELFKEGQENSYFVKSNDGNIIYAPVWPGLVAFPDFTDPHVRLWWGSKYKFYLDHGIKGFWHDMNEPAVFTIWGDNTLPLSAQHKVGEHIDAHNLYGLFMAESAYSSLTKLMNERPFILSRSGWAGLQKYAWTWTGDTESTWAELHETISTIINLGFSGIPYAGVDIGGFSGSPSPELFLRWFQMGAFLPLFRVHSSKGTRMREPWLFGEKIMQIMKNFLGIRYKLIPYIYTLTYEANRTGKPLIRPVSFIDPSLSDVDDEFLLGDSILIVPILHQNAKSVYVRLPDGEWYDFWDDSLKKNTFLEKVDLSKIPIYVRSGSIIPMENNGSMEIHIYGNGEAEGIVYMDDESLDPKYTIHKIRMEKVDGKIILTWKRDGDFDDNYKEWKFVFHGMKVEKAKINGKTIKVEKNEFAVEEKFEIAEIE